jgi:hypothetical protein
MRNTSLIAVVLAAVAGRTDAQTTEVAREADPRRFAEPHLVVHPANPAHLLAATWSGLTTTDPDQARRCATFVSVNGGTT